MWCDTKESWTVTKDTQWTRPEDVVHNLAMKMFLRKSLVTITGGNPLLWDGCIDLINLLHTYRCEVALETQASIPKTWLAMVDYPILSPKAPSSAQPLRMSALRECIRWAPHASIKVVVFDKTDLDFAKMIHVAFPKQRFFLSVGTPDPEVQTPFGPVVHDNWNQERTILKLWSWLSEVVLEDPTWHGVSVLPQLHKLVGVQ